MAVQAAVLSNHRKKQEPHLRALKQSILLERFHLSKQSVALFDVSIGVAILDGSLSGRRVKAKLRCGDVTLLKSKECSASSDSPHAVDFAFSETMIFEDCRKPLAVEINEVQRVLPSRRLCTAQLAPAELLRAAFDDGVRTLSLAAEDGRPLATLEMRVRISNASIELQNIGGTAALKIHKIRDGPKVSGQVLSFGTEKEEALAWLATAGRARANLMLAYAEVFKAKQGATSGSGGKVR